MNINVRIMLRTNCLSIIGSVLILPVFYSCSKSHEVPVADLSNLSPSFYEDAPGGSVSVPVTLSGSFDKTVTISYSTADSTAIAGQDYEPVTSGMISFQPGQSLKNITLNIFQDTAQKKDVAFKILFSDPVNCTLKGSVVPVIIRNTDYSMLAWSDEFNSGPLNEAVWNYETGAGGWGNNELETYTNSINNVHIDSGYLHITAREDAPGYYTSGRLTTQGKKEFTNCRVDIRAELPEGQGLWPALWMLGSNITSVSWPACGEIDIMELLGNHPETVYGTVHWNQNGHVSFGSMYSLSSGKFSNGFHVFSLIWAPNHFEWLIDKESYLYAGRSQAGAFPFNLPQFFVFNVAVGGNWPGSPDGTTIFPQNMIVDYIRVYQ
jgi:beta-glucanase (GH16 family)